MPNVVLPTSISLVRPDDLLNLTVSTVNLRLDDSAADDPVVVVANPDADALLIVEFAPQTIFEEAFFDSSPDADVQFPDSDQQKSPPGTPPGLLRTPQSAGSVEHRIGGPTRLVFRIPRDARIPYSTDGLLNWDAFTLVVTPIADVPANGEPPHDALTIRAPRDTETTLQLPFRLHMSPTHVAGWDHMPEPVTHAGRTELWHTALTARDPDGTPTPVSELNPIGLRVIWSPDYVPGSHVPAPGPTGLSGGAIAAMDNADRHQLVILTSAFAGYSPDGFQLYTPEPTHASMVMLSALGGWLRAAGKWDPPTMIKPHLREVINVSDILQPDRLVTHAAPNEVEAAPHAADAVAAVRPSPVIGQRFYGPARYDLDLDGKLDLLQWTHIAAQGRDHYVRLVYEGHLAEMGHRASLVKVSERRFENSPDGHPVAYLRQFMYIVVTEPEKDYTVAGLAHEGRGMPLKRVRLTTLVTPHIDDPYEGPAHIPGKPIPAKPIPGKTTTGKPTTGKPIPGQQIPDIPVTTRSFWIMVGGQDFLFHGIAEDVAGNRIDFAKPFIFVPNSETQIDDIDSAIAKSPGRLTMAIPGQRVTFAEPDPGDGKDNTSFVTNALQFQHEDATDLRDVFFKPQLTTAQVHIPSVEAVTGRTAGTAFSYTDSYLAGGFGDAANQTGAFAKLAMSLGAGFQAAQAGGLATPNLSITTLTRAVGPLGGDPVKARSDDFDPKTVFQNGAKLFGAFDLADFIPSGKSSTDAPSMQVHRDATSITTVMDWTTPITPPDASSIVTFTNKDDTRLSVHAVIRKDLTGLAGSSELTGRLNDFVITFLDSLAVNFTAFTFASKSGSKTDVNVSLNEAIPVQFINDLAFVEELRQLIPPGVFGDGVSIDLIENPLGVKAGLAIGLPPAAVGVFALKNIAFSAELTIPFLDGKPVVGFGFASRAAPFQLAVLIFGGGGFFHLEVDTDGIRELEAAFEFGVTAALNLGVASGEVHLLAGIYFKMEKKKSSTAPELGEVLQSSLSGYLRCGGTLCVLGIVRVSVEFYLCFTYDLSDQKAKGSATLTVEVEIACFSKSIELTVERAFGGKGGDPSFDQSFDTPELWSEYADAFA